MGQNLQAQLLKEVPFSFQPVLHYGIKGGVNISSISEIATNDPFIGFHTGVFGAYQVSENSGFGAEINYSRQGVSGNFLDISLSYLNIPVMINLYDGPATFQLGAYGARLLKADSRVGLEKQKINQMLEKNDFGLVVGLTYCPMGVTFVGARFNLGLMNINDHLTTSDQVNLRNRNAQIQVGYKF